jgi:protein O-mannosyl-transferase
LKKKRPATKASETATAPAPGGAWADSRWYAALALLALAVYANTLGNGFVSDDAAQMVRNPLISQWRNLPQLFLGDAFRPVHPEEASNYYRPIQFTVYLLLNRIAGFQSWFFHLAMVTIHVINTLLVFALAGNLLRGKRAALVAGALFAVHPIHSEAVAWIAVLPDVLLTAIVLATILVFLRQRGAPQGSQIAGHAGLFLAALLTKETGIVLPALLVACELLYLGRRWREVARNRWLYASHAVTLGVYVALRYHALGGLLSQTRVFPFTAMEFLWSASLILGQYLGKLLWPTNLSYFHPFQPQHSASLLAFACLIVVLALAVAIIVWRRRAPLLSWGLFFILAPLAPALNLAGLGESVFNERYLYLSSVGFVWIVALGWEWLENRNRAVAWILVVVAIIASSCEVVLRNRDWHDDMSLLSATVQQWPRTASLRGYLGKLYQVRGDYDRAFAEYRTGLQLQPNDPMLHNNLAGALALTGRTQEAIQEYRESLALETKPETYLNLGMAFESLGDSDHAEEAYENALRIRSNYPEALNSLALLRRKAKDYTAAIDLLQRAAAARPTFTAAHFNLGVTYSDMGRYAEAAPAFQKALESSEDSSSLYLIHYGLGICYVNLNSPQAAGIEFSKSLELKPDFERARKALETLRSLAPAGPPASTKP